MKVCYWSCRTGMATHLREISFGGLLAEMELMATERTDPCEILSMIPPDQWIFSTRSYNVIKMLTDTLLKYKFVPKCIAGWMALSDAAAPYKEQEEVPVVQTLKPFWTVPKPCLDTKCHIFQPNFYSNQWCPIFIWWHLTQDVYLHGSQATLVLDPITDVHARTHRPARSEGPIIIPKLPFCLCSTALSI
ncbi:hypothetical protein llap_13506 [Limosa lapponica baueri]|uniref:Uncharacterized protein n=1 Tax=Limosa lapponica baueri TaxID=1758121 RepID=A0A2I0TQX7_LIMLA|nr:hypothetical protein llap_13506 [Limosa lapponica baueri]